MAAEYDFTLTDGSPLATVYSLETNGPGSLSTPRQILDIGFTTGLNYFVVSDNGLAAHFPSSFNVINSPYSGSYTVASALPTGTNTQITVNESITANPFTILGINFATQAWIIEGVNNGECLFYPGSNVEVTGNSYPSANTVYSVTSAVSSQPFSIIGITTGFEGTIQIVGTDTSIFYPGQLIEISANGIGNGQYTVMAVVAHLGITTITVTGIIPLGTAPSGIVYPVLDVTIVTIVGTIPPLATVSGMLTPPVTTSYSLVSAPLVTSNTILWTIAGNHATEFTVGCQLAIKDNTFYPYQQFNITTSTNVGPNTEILVSYTAPIIPTPDGSGVLLYPTPVTPYGSIQYSGNVNSSLELVGKGAPYYNTNTTWGMALQNNQIHMLENFAYTSPPVAPLTGQLWYNTASSGLNLYNGSGWNVISSGISPVTQIVAGTNVTISPPSGTGVVTINAAGAAAGVTSFNTRIGAVTLTSSDVTTALTYTPANIASPAFTGVPTAPTAVASTNTTQLATTAFVQAAVAPLATSATLTADVATINSTLTHLAPLLSPALTGVPTAPTAVPGTSTTQLATTAFVEGAVANIPANTFKVGAVAGSGILTFTLYAPCTITSTYQGIITTNDVTSNLSISLPLAASIGATTGNLTRLLFIYLPNNNSLAVVNLQGSLADENTSLTPVVISSSATSLGVKYSASGTVAGSYKIVGFVDAIWTSGTGWATPTNISSASGASYSLSGINGLGYGQTWQIPARTLGVGYYNTTGRPFDVAISLATGAGGSEISAVGYLYVGGVIVGEVDQTVPAYSAASYVLYATIPDGVGYYISVVENLTLNQWAELR